MGLITNNTMEGALKTYRELEDKGVNIFNISIIHEVMCTQSKELTDEEITLRASIVYDVLMRYDDYPVVDVCYMVERAFETEGFDPESWSISQIVCH